MSAKVHVIDGALAAAPGTQAREARAYARAAMLRKHGLSLVALVLLALVIFMAALGPALIGHDPNMPHLDRRLLPPFSSSSGGLHLLGTDGLGRDTAARLAVGAQASLGVVISALLLGGGIGVSLGVYAGYSGGWRDSLVMRLVDAQLSVPNLIFAMVIASVLGVGFQNTVLALGLATWPVYARLLRAEVMGTKTREYVIAAKVLGVGTSRLIGFHILPNVVGSLAIVGTLELGQLVLAESALSFVGLGIQPPTASWGSMIRQGQNYIYTAWWLSAIPGFAIMITVLGLNLVGDWLRDLFDPQVRA